MQALETQLIDRASRGEEAAFHQLVDQNAAYLFRAAYGLLGSRADAEDVVQETFLAAYRSLAKFAGRSSLRTWLMSILINQAALIRRKRKGVLRLAADFEHEDVRGAPLTSAVDARIDVARMLADLSAEYREVLVLRECQGLSYQEIAQALHIPAGTVESRLFRARQELRKRFGDLGSDTDSKPDRKLS